MNKAIIPVLAIVVDGNSDGSPSILQLSSHFPFLQLIVSKLEPIQISVLTGDGSLTAVVLFLVFTANRVVDAK